MTIFNKLRTGPKSLSIQVLSLRRLLRTGSSTTGRSRRILLRKKLTGPIKHTSVLERTLAQQLNSSCHSKRPQMSLNSTSRLSQISLLVSFTEWLVTTISMSLRHASKAQSNLCHTWMASSMTWRLSTSFQLSKTSRNSSITSSWMFNHARARI